MPRQFRLHEQNIITFIATCDSDRAKKFYRDMLGRRLEAAKALQKDGVKFERYHGIRQDDLGIWTSLGGGRVAWFRDPDGNTLSASFRKYGHRVSLGKSSAEPRPLGSRLPGNTRVNFRNSGLSVSEHRGIEA